MAIAPSKRPRALGPVTGVVRTRRRRRSFASRLVRSSLARASRKVAHIARPADTNRLHLSSLCWDGNEIGVTPASQWLAADLRTPPFSSHPSLSRALTTTNRQCIA